MRTYSKLRLLYSTLPWGTLYSPPKGGPPLEFINQRGSVSRFHQLDGGLPLEFININLKIGGPPLETIAMDLGTYSGIFG